MVGSRQSRRDGLRDDQVARWLDVVRLWRRGFRRSVNEYLVVVEVVLGGGGGSGSGGSR